MPPRLERRHQTGNIHLITISCHGRAPLLIPCEAKETFLRSLETTRILYDFQVYGYELMPEHVHLLLSEPSVKPLSTAIAVVKRNTSRSLEACPFWLRRYHDFNVHRTGPKVIEKLRYLHRNPVSRGLTEKPEDYSWSTFRHYAFNEAVPVQIVRVVA